MRLEIQGIYPLQRDNKIEQFCEIIELELADRMCRRGQDSIDVKIRDGEGKREFRIEWK